METLIRIVQLIFALSILILVHEAGHFLFARLFRIRVEKFYLFFPPAIFKFKPKGSDTEFGIGCIPLGGFCKISGMIDESMDREQMESEPQPWEFRSHPAWQRLLVMVGGVLMNFVLALVLYCAICFTWGEQYLRTEDAIYGVEVSDLASEIGFRSGDIPLKFGDTPVPDNFALLQTNLVYSGATSATVLRDGDTVTFPIDQVYLPAMINSPGMFGLRAPLAVASVPDSSINAAAGMMVGDHFGTVEGRSVRFYPELRSVLEARAGEAITMQFVRDGADLEIPLRVGSDGKIGVGLAYVSDSIVVTNRDYSLKESIPAGWNMALSSLQNYMKDLGLIFRPETKAYKSVGSFISIGSIFPASWDWEIFWRLTAFLSIMLAVLNILPIPALDGGHILFTLFEILTGRKPSQKFLEVTQVIGMLLLLMLFFLAMGNDIMKLLR